MNPRGILVHGIYSEEGETNVSNMQKPLEEATGMDWVLFEYGFTSMLQAYFTNHGHAQELADVMVDGDIIVCHSNGAAVTYLACTKYGAKPGGVVLVQPALQRDLLPDVPWAQVYYNADDEVTAWSRLLPWNHWGNMGQVGYMPGGVPVPRRTIVGGRMVSQVDTIGDARSHGLPEAHGHSAIFQSPDVIPWGHFIGQNINLARRGNFVS